VGITTKGLGWLSCIIISWAVSLGHRCEQYFQEHGDSTPKAKRHVAEALQQNARQLGGSWRSNETSGTL